MKKLRVPRLVRSPRSNCYRRRAAGTGRTSVRSDADPRIVADAYIDGVQNRDQNYQKDDDAERTLEAEPGRGHRISRQAIPLRTDADSRLRCARKVITHSGGIRRRGLSGDGVRAALTPRLRRLSKAASTARPRVSHPDFRPQREAERTSPLRLCCMMLASLPWHLFRGFASVRTRSSAR